MKKSLNLGYVKLNTKWWTAVFKSRIKFTNLVLMIADQNIYDMCFTFFYPTASAMAEGENCAFGPTLGKSHDFLAIFAIAHAKINQIA